MKAIESRDVSFQFIHRDTPFLKNINLEVEVGECILICGKSGSGKTTFNRLLNGVSPNFVNGTLTGTCKTLDLIAGEAAIEEYVPVVGSVFQNPKTQHFSVDTTSELALPCENMGMEPSAIRKRIKERAELFEIEHLLDRNIFKLSGGEKQQIAFVAATMLNPEIIVLDEVTSNLDRVAVQRIGKMIARLKQQGVTVVMSEHRLAWTRDVVDRYIYFEQGMITNEWSNDDFIALSEEELHRFGLRSLDLNTHVAHIEDKVQEMNVNEGVKTLQTKELSVGYSTGRAVLENLNLQFSAGHIVGLLGPNGTGKSTLAYTLTGLRRPLSGEIYWEGQKQSSRSLIEKSFLVMQDTNYQLFSDSVSEEVLLGAKYPERKNAVLEQLNLTAYEDQHPMSLSEGQKQRLAIASALVSGKELIIFDEPTSGLDYEHMMRFGELLSKLKETGVIIIVITHDEELASIWCDQIIALEKKK